jgi:hypothetical protein
MQVKLIASFAVLLVIAAMANSSPVAKPMDELENKLAQLIGHLEQTGAEFEKRAEGAKGAALEELNKVRVALEKSRLEAVRWARNNLPVQDSNQFLINL